MTLVCRKSRCDQRRRKRWLVADHVQVGCGGEDEGVLGGIGMAPERVWRGGRHVAPVERTRRHGQAVVRL